MNRLLERDILGAVTILLVVLQHSSQAFVSWKLLWGIDSTLLAGEIALTSGFTMPLFIMIAGLLFQFSLSQGKYTETHDFLDKKVKRLLLPFLIFSPFMIYFFPVGNDSLYAVFELFLNGAHHLWFVITLLYAYLFFYFFRNLLDKSPIVSLVILMLMAIGGHYLKIKYGGLFGLSNMLIYFFYFYLGMQVYKNNTSGVFNFNPWILLSLYLSIRIVHMLYFRFDEHVWINSILPVFEGGIGVLCAWNHSVIYGPKIMKIANRTIHFISRNAYGIYFFHLPIIYGMIEIFRNYDPINIYFIVFILFSISLLISILLTEGLRKIGFKMVIGE